MRPKETILPSVLNTRPSVSVVIAVYNVENYIAQCCHSLFSQTLKSIEYIFVNDCTPDASINIVKTILKGYPNRAKQVKFIEHSVNLGISRTREDGIKAATGEFLIHCDPDDWIESDMYEQMYKKAISEEADLVFCDINYYYPESRKSYYGKEMPKEMSGRSILASCLHAQRPILHGCLWNKLIRLTLYRTVEWYPNISSAEDVIACVQILQHPIKVSYIPRAFYYYRQREGAITHREYTREVIESDYAVIDILHQHLCSSGDTELYRYWQASVAWFLAFALHTKRPIYTNSEYLKKYRKYRGCILKDKGLAQSARWYLYCTTYNYIIPFSVLQFYRRIRHFFSAL